MATKIFVNLPVQNLEKSKSFYTSIGFTINPQFSDETAACVVISEDIYVMLLTHDKFKQFIKNDIADATTTTGVINALSTDSKDQVNQIADKAEKNGGKKNLDPQDLGFMYNRSFSDPDGHIWEIVWMDPSAVQ